MLGTFLRKYYIMDIERPMVLGRDEDDLRQNRNSILYILCVMEQMSSFLTSLYLSEHIMDNCIIDIAQYNIGRSGEIITS